MDPVSAVGIAAAAVGLGRDMLLLEVFGMRAFLVLYADDTSKSVPAPHGNHLPPQQATRRGHRAIPATPGASTRRAPRRSLADRPRNRGDGGGAPPSPVPSRSGSRPLVVARAGQETPS